MNPTTDTLTESALPIWTRKRRATLLVGIGVVLATVLCALAAYSVVHVKRQANKLQSQNNLKELVLAFHACCFDDAPKHRLPGQAILHPRTGQPLLSWRVTLLPYLGEESLYKQIRLDESWDSDHNRQFWDKMPKVYQLPGKPSDGTTYYQVFHGDGALFGKPKRLESGKIFNGVAYGLGNIPDGPGNTIFAIEAANPVNWMKPEDILFEIRSDGTSLDPVGNHRADDWFLVTMCDGSIRSANRSTLSPLTLQAFIQPDDAVPVFKTNCN